jgi:L-ascorbate metabolism protein UlaG (beta-lactamase superfamily)
MYIQRLSWAGLQVTVGATSVFIDPIGTTVANNLGQPDVPLAAQVPSRFALLTHAHPDHYDPVALQAILGNQGRVITHQSITGLVAKPGLHVQGVQLYEPVLLEWQTAELVATAVPAVDGWGVSQVSWIVEGDGARIIHCGDTLWHGHWWDIARQYGPFDMAFLPINGVIYTRGRFIGSDIPATLTPEQAATAAHLLGAKVVCPIHYGRINDPQHYVETPDAEARFLAAVAQRKGTVRLLAPGEKLEIGTTVDKR